MIKNGRWEEKELDFLKNNYNNMTHLEMAQKLNRTKNAVSIKASKLSLIKESKYTYNKEYFKEINTPEKAYWLGFIYADGYIVYSKEKRNYEFSIELASVDKNHLKKFNKSINGNLEVKTFIKNPNHLVKTHREMCSIRFYSIEIVEDLMDKGVYLNKTNKLEFPNWLEDNLKYDFIRGFLDGDGSIMFSKNDTASGRKIKNYGISFECNVEKFLIDMKAYLMKSGVYSNIYKDGNSFKMQIRRKDSVKIFLENIYNDDNCICLDRKLKKKSQLYNYVAV